MNHLAIDLGAESGRVILGSLTNGKIELEEIHRFPNGYFKKNGSMFWKFNDLQAGVAEGLRKAAAQPEAIASVSTDAWGVDYALNFPVGDEVHHYRDARSEAGVKKVLAKILWEEIFAETGIQFMPINTLFQLAAETRPLDGPGTLLSVADYVNHWLGGEAVIEESMASTFQLYNPRQRAWSDRLLDVVGLKKEKIGRVVPSGTVIGTIQSGMGKGLLAGARIIATCSHDTGAAVAAVPAVGRNWAYLSSGTWSLMGVERAEPVINDRARELNFTNEIGYGGSIRLLKNISGMWLLQECRRAWMEKGKNFDYAELTRLAEKEEPASALIDPMDARFLAPANMPRAITEFCSERKLEPPTTPGGFTRCIFQSLAQLYARTLGQLEELTGVKIEWLHIVGGGSKNAFLNQLTANACRIPVLAGPVEATALGNVAIQAITLGEISSLTAARESIALSFVPVRFDPA